MFASMFKTFFNKIDQSTIVEQYGLEPRNADRIGRDDVEKMLSQLDEIKENSSNCRGPLSTTSKDDIIESFESMSIVEADIENLVDDGGCLVNHFDDTKSEVSSIGEKVDDLLLVEDSEEKITINKINNLKCLFTWNIKSPVRKKNIILSIQNNYGEYNMDISSPEFTFERYTQIIK